MKRPKGTHDIYGLRQQARQYVLATLQQVAQTYHFQQIDTPVFETATVFTKGIGVTSDIIKKEMYLFEDKKARQFALKPEGTSGIMRAIVENKLLAQKATLKLFYQDWMFRYERPQKGRQRQFSQFGVEYLGAQSYIRDSEVILMAHTMLKTLQLDFKLKLNYLGTAATRAKYTAHLRTYFQTFKTQLSPISLVRLEQNPLRILDDKLEQKKAFVINAPQINAFYTDEDTACLEMITNYLDLLDIKYHIDYNLMRGLDYYSGLIFEFVATGAAAGAKNTLIGGGRYDQLLAYFGGPNISGIGFGIGIERLVEQLVSKKAQLALVTPKLDLYISVLTAQAEATAHSIAYLLRSVALRVETSEEVEKLPKAFTKAQQLEAQLLILIGEKEIAKGVITIKNQITGRERQMVVNQELISFLKNELAALQTDSQKEAIDATL